MREPWLTQVGAAAKVTDAGAVLMVVVATGEPDRAALAAQLAASEARATDLVNRARTEASLPPLRVDPTLVAAAKTWLAQTVQRGCFADPSNPTCPGAGPTRTATWTGYRSPWVDGDAAFTWDLRPAEVGDDRLKRFGAAATLAPDGTVWSLLVMDT